MINVIRQKLAPPIFEDEDKTRIAGVLNTILVALFVILIVLALITNYPLTMLITIAMAALTLAMWFVMRRGHVRLVSVLISSMLLIGISAIVYSNGTIRAPAASGYVATVVIAGLLIGNRAALGVAVLSILILFGLFQAEAAGQLPPIFFKTSGYLQWATHAGILSMTAVLLSLANSSLHAALERARRNERALIENNRNLQAEIAERKRAEAERQLAEDKLRALLAEKDVLLAEIHHRVKNNLQVLISLLNLQAASVKDESVLQVLRDSQSRVRSMAIVHERLYQSADLARIDVDGYIRQLAAGLFRIFDVDPATVLLKIRAENAFLGIDEAIPFGLIINELISNALKYAFPPSAQGTHEIRVEFFTGGDQLTLVVGDNGVGISEAIDFQNTKSLGLQLVHILATHDLQGTIELNQDEGTEFKITFPAPGREAKNGSPHTGL